MEYNKFVVIRRADKKTYFTSLNKGLDEINNIYDTSIRASFPAFTDRMGRKITGITEAEEVEYEKKLKLAKGTLSNTSDFWDRHEMRITLEGVSTRLPIDDPLGELKWKMAKAQPIVAVNGVPRGDAKHYNPEKHQFVIYEPEMEAKAELEKIKYEIQAGEEFNKLDDTQIREASTFYNLPTKGQSNDIVKANLYKEVKRNPKKFTTLLKDPYYKTKLFVNECVREGVVKKTNKGYFWSDDQTVPIAYNLEQFVEMLESKTDQDLTINLKQRLAEAKKKK